LIRLLTLLLLLSFSFSLVTEVNFTKIVNGNSGLEFLIKDTINYNGADIKWGISETFTGPRENITRLNHNGVRVDLGCYWKIEGFMVGYTHSERFFFEGATNTDVFDQRARDTISIRKEL
jgi:hypothetical protein